MDKVFITDCYILTKEVLENMLIKELLSSGIKIFNGQPVEKLKLEQVFVSHADMMAATNAGLSVSQGANIGFKFSPPPNQIIGIDTSFNNVSDALMQYQTINNSLNEKINKMKENVSEYIYKTNYTNIIKDKYITSEYELYKNEYSKLYQNLYLQEKSNELHDLLDSGEPGYVHFIDDSNKWLDDQFKKLMTLDDVPKIAPVKFDIDIPKVLLNESFTGKEIVVSKDNDGNYDVKTKEEVLNFDNGIRAIEVD